jgi:hypothetical protein
MRGPQVGIGRLLGVGRVEVADRRLGIISVLLEGTVAAAMPEKATERARMRTASFIVGYSLGI